MVTYSYVSPTSHSEPSGDWHNPARVYDGNWNNYADVEAHYYMADGGRLDWWSNWLTLIFATSYIIDRIRLKCVNNPWYEVGIQIYNQNTSTWDEVWDAQLTQNTQVEISFPNTTSDRVRIRASLSGVEFDLYELDARRVVPDSGQPAPPNTTVGYQQKIEEQKSTAATCIGYGSRMRGRHRITKLIPVLVG